MGQRSLLLSATLVASSALLILASPAPARAQGTTYQSEQDRERSTEAYQDGLRHGRDDARAGTRNDSPGDRWTLPGDQTAWRDGYSAGYQEISSQMAAPGASGPDLNSIPARYGYDDGLAQGQKDKEKGESFRPTTGDFYKHSDHGWSADYGDKEHYKQVYRQAYAKGYQEGYNGGIPH